MSELARGSVVRFLAVGVLNTMLGLACIYAVDTVMRLGDVASNLIGYTIAVIFSFSANRRWTFRHTGGAMPAFGRYLLVLVAAYLANLAAMLAARDLFHQPSAVAQLAGVLPYALLGYLGSRWFAFRQPR
jgi:putative flippase GtrA